MGKPAKQVDPLQAQAQSSRVAKSRQTQKDRRTRILPPWFYRIQAIYLTEERDVDPEDFDEDLSEIESDESDDMDEDDESERSYDGSDADEYYELKEEREERKYEKMQERKRKRSQQEIERTKEEEIFNLFCADHMEHFYSDFLPTKRVEFYHLDDTDDASSEKQKLGGEADMLYGHVYLDHDTDCSFGPFHPPEIASPEAIKVKTHDGKYELLFTFIGNGYLKLRLPREVAIMESYSVNPLASQSAVPETFEFVGIWFDWEKEKAELKERMEKTPRSPSPRESWFEMNHPMGAYYDPEYSMDYL